MKEKNINFNKKTGAKKRSKLFLPLVLCAVILTGAVSFLVIMIKNDFDFSKFTGIRKPGEETTSPSEETTLLQPDETAAPFSDDEAVSVLFYCTDDGVPSFLELVVFSAKENAIRIKPLALNAVCVREAREYTLSALYEQFGISAVRDALAQKGYSVHRVAGFTETNFKRLLSTLGEVQINVPHDTVFHVDAITYTLSAGVQSMKPDVLLQYMKYAFSGDEKLKAEGAAFAEILRTHLTAENVERGEDFFSGIINLADTDITMFDYAGYKERLSVLLSAAPEITVIS